MFCALYHNTQGMNTIRLSRAKTAVYGDHVQMVHICKVTTTIYFKTEHQIYI